MNGESNTTKEFLVAAKQFCEAMMECGAGAVQVQVSWMEDGFTKGISQGDGNWYARVGMAREFIEKDQAETQSSVFACNRERGGDA